MDDGTGRRSAKGTGGRRGRRAREPGPPVRADRLLSGALDARLRDDLAAFSRCTAELAGRPGEPSLPGGPVWSRVVDRALAARLVAAVTCAWRLGWQPADVVRVVRRRRGRLHARMAVDAIAAEMSHYSVMTVDDRWRAQLAELGASPWSREAVRAGEWRAPEGVDRDAMVSSALDVLVVLVTLPELPRLCPLPGEARRPASPAFSGAPGSSARPGADAGASERAMADERTLARVRALLAKAESTEFPEEAEALSARAQELMTRHRIDDALLAAGTARGDDEPAGRRVGVDSPYEAPKTMLLDAVARANRCRVVWHRGFCCCTVLGLPADLDAVELLFTSLLVQATTAMVAAGPRRDPEGRPRTRSFRRSFLMAYAQRVGERLTEASETAERGAAAESPHTDLLPVLAARDEAVDAAVGRMFPDLGRATVTSAHDRDGWLLGRAAADLAALHGRDEVADAGGRGRSSLRR